MPARVCRRAWAWADSVDAKVIPLLDARNIDGVSPDLCVRVFAAQQTGVFSWAADGYSALRDGTRSQGDLLASLHNTSETVFTPLEYNPAQELAIARPASAITVNASQYDIFGTSDPDEPLLLDGRPLERQSTDGVFNMLASLDWGRNTFVFSQGGRSETGVITRQEPAPAKTWSITSAFPVSSALAENGKTLTITCVAPAGSAVRASWPATDDAFAARTRVAGTPAALLGEICPFRRRNGKSSTLAGDVYAFVQRRDIHRRLQRGCISVRRKRAPVLSA